MEQERINRNCPLWGTDTCAQLNMRACRGCPAEGKDVRECDAIREDVETFRALLPEEGVHGLFTGEGCTLCRGENPGQRESYGIFDMGHDDPRGRQKKLSLFRGKTFGFVVPLQFGCCKACRRRYQLLGWLPMLITVVILGTALLLVSRETVAESLRNVWRGLPLLVMLLAAGLCFLLSKVLSNVLRARFNRHTYMDLRDHPLVRQMLSLGWETVAEGKYPQPVFTRKRLAHGIGTAAIETDAPSRKADEKITENGENFD